MAESECFQGWCADGLALGFLGSRPEGPRLQCFSRVAFVLTCPIAINSGKGSRKDWICCASLLEYGLSGFRWSQLYWKEIFPVGQPASLFPLLSFSALATLSEFLRKRTSRQWPGGFGAIYLEQWTISRLVLLEPSGMEEQGFSLTISCRMVFL